MSTATATRVPAFQLKAGLHPVNQLILQHQSPQEIADELNRRLQQAPDLFHLAPVVLQLPDAADLHWTREIINLLRSANMIPIGLRGSDNLQDIAQELALPLLKDARKKSKQTAQPSISKVITGTIRSGQQAVNLEGDLIILGAVSAGAEVLATGSIHIYGTLRGRALAGIQGNEAACVSCQSLEAELIAIAGHYRISEDIGAELAKKTCVSRLEQGNLIIQSV